MVCDGNGSGGAIEAITMHSIEIVVDGGGGNGRRRRNGLQDGRVTAAGGRAGRWGMSIF